MPSYRRTRPRVEWGTSRLLFRYRTGDDVAALGGSFARASIATYFDAQGVLRTAASGELRDAHYIDGVRTTLLEEAASNLVSHSEDFTAWTSGGASVIAGQALAPDGTTSMSILDAVAGGSDSRYVNVTYTGDGRKAFGVWLKAASSAQSGFGLYDVTAGAFRHEVRVTWASGIPTLSTVTGSGYLFAPVFNLYTGAWLCAANAAGVVAANSNRLYLYPDTSGANGQVYAWGAMTSNTPTLTSYIRTTGAPATRAADVLSFPFPHAPQHMTVQYDGVEIGLRVAAQTLANSFHLWTVCDSAAANPKLRMNNFSGTGRYQFQRTLASGTQITAGAASDAAQPGDWERFQSRGVLFGDGSILAGIQAASDGTETTGAVVTPNALESTWAGGGASTRLYLNQNGDGNQRNNTAVVSIAFATLTEGMPRMRAVGAGGDILGSVLHCGYPLDEAMSWPDPAEGSAMVFLPSGEADGWDAGEVHRLAGVVRWIPRENTASPVASGWDGAAGWRAFLSWARRGNRFWFCPDETDLSSGWNVHLEAPFDGPPTMEPDMTRALALVLRGTTAFEGY